MFMFRLFEKVFVTLSLLILTGAIDLVNERLGFIGTVAAQGSPISRLLEFGILLGTVFLIIAWRKKVFINLHRDALLWLLVGIALASVLWSDNPDLSLRRSISLVGTTLFGVYLAKRYSVNEQLRLLAWTCGIAVLLSIVVAVILPSYGVMGKGSITTAESIAHTGAWRGIYIHKNSLGRMMVLSAVVFRLLAAENYRWRWAAQVGLGLSVALILLSTSKSSLTIFLTILALLPIYKALRWNYTWAIPFFMTVILTGGAFATLFFGNAETILGALGRDITLTGRTDVWAAVIGKIGERPWLGYGYNAFWLGVAGESEDIWTELHWEVPHSHNGFLDLWLDLGLLGAATFALSFILAYLRAIAWIRLTKTAAGLWPLAYLTFLFLANLTESSLLRQKPLWILYIAVTISVNNWSNSLGKSNATEQQFAESGEM